MKKPNTVMLVSIGVLSIFSSCALRPQLKYDVERMAGYAGKEGRSLKPKQPLPKSVVTEMLVGAGATHGLDPHPFPVNRNTVGHLMAPRPSAVFTFVMLADPQIVDRGWGFGPSLTRTIDKKLKIETTVRNGYQDLADEIYFAFMLKSIRLGMESNTSIDCVINLGDAIHEGTKAELESFNALVGKFLIAGQGRDWEKSWTGTWLQTSIHFENRAEALWLNLLGNHEVFILGTFPRNFPIRVPDGGILGINGLMAALGQTSPFATAGSGQRANVLGEGTAAQGYYSVVRPMTDGKKALLIMLNTNEGTIPDPLTRNLGCATFYPSLGPEQYAWLGAALRGAEDDPAIGAVLVFGHHPLMQITVNATGSRTDRDASFGSVEQLLGGHSKVAAYFCGHLHSGGPPIRHRFDHHVFLEYVCPSLQEFPKCFGLASVSKAPFTDQYSAKVEYFNLEDLLDFQALPPVEVAEDSPPTDQQTRLVNWLADLNLSTTNIEERLRLLAKYCYLGASDDIRHDVRRDISGCFDPKFKRHLMELYSPAQGFWVHLRGDPSWATIRPELEGTALSRSVAQVMTNAINAQVLP